MGLTPVGEQLFFETRPEFTTGSICTNAVSNATGCFTRFGNGKTRITIADLDDPKIRGLIVAHELLYAVYYDLSEVKKTEINELIDTAYQRNQDQLDSRLEAYGQLPTEKFYSELHSFIGSEITDIPAPLEAHYSRYFVDRVGRVANFDPGNMPAPQSKPPTPKPEPTPKPAPAPKTTPEDQKLIKYLEQLIIESEILDRKVDNRAILDSLNWGPEYYCRDAFSLFMSGEVGAELYRLGNAMTEFSATFDFYEGQNRLPPPGGGGAR